jgi:hypothetical protein
MLSVKILSNDILSDTIMLPDDISSNDNFSDNLSSGMLSENIPISDNKLFYKMFSSLCLENLTPSKFIEK